MNFNEKLDLLKIFTESLKKSLMLVVDAHSTAATSKMAFKVFSLKEPLLYRMFDLTSTAYEMYMTNKILPAFLLTRAAIETFVVLFSLRRIILNLLKSKNIEDADEILMKRIFGGRVEELPLCSTNISTLMASADVSFSNLINNYDCLSEICHPNSFGVYMLYSHFDKSKLCLNLGFNPRKLPVELGLNMHLQVINDFIDVYNDINNYLIDFIKICDSGLDFDIDYKF